MTRVEILPEIPTLDEQGIKGYDAIAWAGLVAPAGTPRPVLERLNAEVVKIVNSADIQQKFGILAMIPVSESRDQFAAFLKADSQQWANAVRVSGATAE